MKQFVDRKFRLQVTSFAPPSQSFAFLTQKKLRQKTGRTASLSCFMGTHWLNPSNCKFQHKNDVIHSAFSVFCFSDHEPKTPFKFLNNFFFLWISAKLKSNSLLSTGLYFLFIFIFGKQEKFIKNKITSINQPNGRFFQFFQRRKKKTSSNRMKFF